jgi:bifunctional non-homologous end joining protein LigD
MAAATDGSNLSGMPRTVAAPTDLPPAAGATRSSLPTSQEPQLATAAKAVPDGSGWLSELKLDGYRLLVWIDSGRVRLVTRNGRDWTDRMPALAERFKGLKVDTALIDGELVALRPDGTPSFHDLQNSLTNGRDRSLYFYAFDILHLNGWDLRNCDLIDRKCVLEGVHKWAGYLRYTEHVDCDPALLLAEARRLKLEGIIVKRADAAYRGGRRPSWLKIKASGREDFIVLGWTPPGGSRRGIGGLALGFYDPVGRLHYAGVVGTGFSDRELLDYAVLGEAMASTPPTTLLAAGDQPDRAIRWIRPELIIEVSFTAWSGEGRVRHPVYLGLREDKIAAEVVMEVPDPTAERRAVTPVGPAGDRSLGASRWKGAVPPRHKRFRLGEAT